MKLRYILIPFLAVLLMSHNAGAISLNIPVEQKDVIQSPYWRYYVSGVGDSSWSNSSTVTRKSNDANITRIQLRDNNNLDLAFSAGDYIELNVWQEFYLINNSNNTSMNQLGYFDITNASSNCNIVKIDVFSQEWLEGTSPTQWLRWEGTITCSLRTSGTNPTINLTVKSNGVNFSTPTNTMRFGIKSYTVYGVNDHDVNAEQEQATQDASDDSENTSNEANEDVEGGTSNLLDVFGGFVTAITGASASNCVINAPLNTSFSNDRLNVDLCGLDLPTPIGVLTSIIAILVVVPFAISMFNKFIGIIGSFQS